MCFMTTPLPPDAFAFFGAAGDLAYEKVFPPIQAMIPQRPLDGPIIGIARAHWSLERLPCH